MKGIKNVNLILSFTKRHWIILLLVAAIPLVHFWPTSSKRLPPHGEKILFTTPDIRVYDNFISQEEAKHLISLASERLIPSKVQVKNERIQIKDRTSSSALLLKSEDEIVKRIEERACAIVNCDPATMEPLQVVHYSKGQQYKPHYDFYSEVELPHQSGQRVHTFLVYLNELEPNVGGETLFPHLFLTVRPLEGRALYFRDTTPDGKGDPLTLHGGNEVLKEGVEKWACNIWIRDKPFVAVNQPAVAATQ